MQRYNFTKNKHRNKKVKKLGWSRVRCQPFHSYLHHMICTNNCYSFGSKKPICKYGSFLNHRRQSVYQVPLPLVIGLYGTWDKKGIHIPVCVFPSQVLVLKIVFVILNSASISMEYNQIMQSYLGEHGGLLHILIDKPTKMMCSCSGKIRSGKIEESSLSGKTHIHAI